RFSVVATVALVVVGLAGVTLSVIILDGPGELVSTSWGRLLMIKAALVAIVAAAGGYNHLVLLPRLEVRPDDRALASHFRRVAAGEALLLLVVVGLTAWLVGAAS
ncbi:MAG: CopD family protein, partial [Actinomycetota bacterium]